jgi:hypothetical protein
MPSQYDNTYHWEYSKPTYDSVTDKAKFDAIREADYVFEIQPASDPNRQQELDYMNWYVPLDNQN